VITINVTVQELDVILRALCQRPYAEVKDLIPNLVMQANAPKPEPAADPAPG
jgi:hypothetical protein